MLWPLIMALSLVVVPPPTITERIEQARFEELHSRDGRRAIDLLTLDADAALGKRPRLLPVVVSTDFWFMSDHYPVVTYPGEDEAWWILSYSWIIGGARHVDEQTSTKWRVLSHSWLTGGARVQPKVSRTVEGLVVGEQSLGMLQKELPGLAPPKLNDAKQQRLLVRLNPGDDPRSDPFSVLGQIFDVTNFDLPDFQADVITLAIPTGSVQPFAAIAHQYDELDTINRYGIGGGTRWLIGPNANFGTQLLYFPGDRAALNADESHGDVRCMTRLEIGFYLFPLPCKHFAQRRQNGVGRIRLVGG